MAIGTGIGVDSKGGPVVDPTVNVIALVESNAQAAAALRDADVKFNDVVAMHLREIGSIRAQHAKETREFDTAQQSNIRSVDMANAEKTAAQILQAVTTNAQVAERTAKTLQDQVASTATAAENRQASFASDMMKRLSAVELSMSEGKGKQQIADPQMDKLTLVVETLARNQVSGAGRQEGMSDSAKILMGALALITTLLGFYTFTQRQTVAPAPQIIYVPAPATGVPLPNTPQTGVTR